MFDLIVWVLLGAVAALAVSLVFIIVWFVLPMKNSPGKFFLRAKRNKKPVCFLDNGSHWLVAVGESEEEEGFIRDKNGNVIAVSPNSLKYCHGVLVGVGENYRSMLVNPAIAGIIQMAVEKKLKIPDIQEAMRSLEEKIKGGKDSA